MTLVITGKLLRVVLMLSDVERCLKDIPESYSSHLLKYFVSTEVHYAL